MSKKTRMCLCCFARRGANQFKNNDPFCKWCEKNCFVKNRDGVMERRHQPIPRKVIKNEVLKNE